MVPINVNTSTWLDNLKVKMVNKEKIELPIEVIEKLIEGYLPPSAIIRTSCDSCSEDLYFHRSDFKLN